MIEIIKEKPLKSTTNVKGLIVQVTGGQWYGLTKMQPPRNTWFGRAGKSTSTGRMDYDRNAALFMKSYSGEPTFEEIKQLLLNVLNNSTEAPKDQMVYR
jgi:hypothetical protein|tara:strand:+ start:137 stop:433 length:297 start_codon:yes stop_codon:yes gene_type:complete